MESVYGRSALVIEDSAEIADVLKIWLEKRGWQVTLCQVRDEAVAILNNDSFSLILLDYAMPGMTAEEFVPMARGLNPMAKLILITGNPSFYEIASQLGIGVALRKPFDEDYLFANINRLFKGSSKTQLRPV